MKGINKLLIGLFFIFWLTGCSDDSFIEIDSLSSDGDEFFCNQKVKIWMNVHSSDLWNTDYEWSADGGILTQPQGLDEMTWKAPNVPGTYTIRCKVTVGGKTDIREKKMYVSSYFHHLELLFLALDHYRLCFHLLLIVLLHCLVFFL